MDTKLTNIVLWKSALLPYTKLAIWKKGRQDTPLLIFMNQDPGFFTHNIHTFCSDNRAVYERVN